MLSLSLPDSYEPLIMALQSRSEVLTSDFMAGHLLQESTRRQAAHTGEGSSPGQSAFIAGGRFKGRRGSHRGDLSQRGMRFHGCGRSTFGIVDTGRFEGKKVVGRCHYCNKEGHWKRDCLKRKADEAGGKFIQDQEGGHTAFAALTANSSQSND